jgi:hypothetical protein
MYRAQQGYQTVDLEARAGSCGTRARHPSLNCTSLVCSSLTCSSPARDASKSPNVIMRRPHFALLAIVILLVSAPAFGAAPGTVSGVVRDSGGVPQIGAEVELLRPDLTVIASVFTNSTGHFVIASVLPGRYAVKAMGTSFLPALREDVRVRTATVVNLTLNTLYEAMQWLPAEPRSANAQQDDWKWTLRSAANRPLLRWLEDGPLVVVSDGAGGSPKLKARLVATGRQGSFGESGERVSASVEDTPVDSRELLAQVDFDPDSNAGMESMLGFRQELGFAGSVESVAAVAIHPDLNAGDSAGLDEAAVRSWETMRLGDEFIGEAGSTQVLARFSQNGPNEALAALPFAMAGWRGGNSTISYRLATALPAAADVEDGSAQAWLPKFAVREGRLAMEHGLHQEISWERSTDRSDVSVILFADRTDNPVMEAAVSRNTVGASASELLYDPASGLVRTAGPKFSTAGMVATAEHRLPRGNELRVSYVSGDALVLGTTEHSGAQPMPLSQLLASAHARRAEACSISLSGTLDGSGTRWRATYRWQPEDTVTSVASFATNAAEPYLNLQFRQPIHLRRDGAGGFEALLDLRNLLAEGYRPYVLSDGTVLVFAQDQRGISGGVAFTF